MSKSRKEKYIWATDEAFNKGNISALDTVLAADMVHHRPPYPDVKGAEAYKQFVSEVRVSYPDVQITFDEMIMEGDTSSGRYTFRGTQTGVSPTTGAPPTGKQVAFTGCVVNHWAGDRIIESWDHSDWLGLLQQLGVIPRSG